MAPKNMAQDIGSFDFIVTGAGSAGCVMAARLSESGKYRVLLLEAGGKDSNPWIHIPMGYAKLFNNPAVNWMFDSEPEEELEGRTMYQPRGKVLGGTSSINGMIYIRGTPSDYDEWRQRGCEGWSWDDVLPFFRKAEDQVRGSSDLHGVGGPLRVSDQPRHWPLAQAMVEAGRQAGLPANADFNGPTQEGVGWYQTTTRDKRRGSTAVSYLHPAKGRQNLVVQTRAHATRLLIENGRAVGVEFQTPGGLKSARAGVEVIVSGGVYGSPQLLLLSGLGPAEQLQRFNIPVIRDMPGVGANLRDHFYLQMVYRCAQPITVNDFANSWPRKIFGAAQYALFRSGMMAGNGMYCGAFARSDQRLERPDLQINMACWSTAERTRTGIRPHPFSGFTMSPVHLRPDAIGYVALKSPDPLAPPLIKFNFFKTEYDRQAVIAGMKLIRKICGQPALAPYVAAELEPGPQVQDDEEFIADIRHRGYSNMHPVGTCHMGHDTHAVVDPQLRVIGIAGLRVVDASIMPSIVAGNTNAPTIMIAEKAAAMVLEAARGGGTNRLAAD